MQIITDSWISSTTGYGILQDLFTDAARNVPDDYVRRPWSYPGLDHGKAVLTTDAQLDCYVHAYGLMHVYKMWKALEHLPLADVMDGFEIIDWGCGQAIATLTLLALLERQSPMPATPRRIVLLDLSPYALCRAKNLVERGLCSRGVDIEAVQTDLAAARCSAKASQYTPPMVIHLLSNIIDVPKVRISAMADVISTSQSKSYVFCAGHCKTDTYAMDFSQHLEHRGALLLHRENVECGAVLPTGKPFGWDITVMQCDSAAKAA